MSELRTEEEQLELIKNWWKQNGTSLLLGIGVAVAIVFGWKTWNANKDAQAANASALYENISTVLSAPEIDEAQKTSVRHLGQQLKDEYESSAYAPMAAMLLARVAVEENNLALAKDELNYVVSNESSDEALKQLAQLRLARIAISEGQLQAAKAALDSTQVEAVYQGLYYELKGDLSLAENDLSAARLAYTEAMERVDPQSRSLIKLKLDDIAEGAEAQ